MKPGLKILEYTPEDMTVTVESGLALAALQTELARHRQWLPLDPPQADRLTISELINANPSGPRRFGYGTIRDYLIGIKVALADGTIIHSGGKVVKNVAGYDLLKLFIGAQGSLGTVLETTFKLRPLPESERFIQARCESLEQADQLIEAVIKSDITPIVLDLHNLPTDPGLATATTSPELPPPSASRSLSPGVRAGVAIPLTIILGFAGTREEVEWQLARAAELGFKESSSLAYAAKFWTDNTPAHRLSVLPSKMIEAIRGLNGVPFLARAGNGVIYHRGLATPPPKAALPLEILRRLKAAYDPNHILPDLPL